MQSEADLIDLGVKHLAEREGIGKYEAYERFLCTPEGMRLLADLRLTQKRYDEESDLRIAAHRLEESPQADLATPLDPAC
jgi:hypothetical protein